MKLRYLAHWISTLWRLWDNKIWQLLSWLSQVSLQTKSLTFTVGPDILNAVVWAHHQFENAQGRLIGQLNLDPVNPYPQNDIGLTKCQENSYFIKRKEFALDDYYAGPK